MELREFMLFLKEFIWGGFLGASVGFLYVINQNLCEKLDRVIDRLNFINSSVFAIQKKLKITQVEEFEAYQEANKNNEKEHYRTEKNPSGYDIHTVP